MKKYIEIVVMGDNGLRATYNNMKDAIKFVDYHKDIRFKVIKREIVEFEIADEVIENAKKYLL